MASVIDHPLWRNLCEVHYGTGRYATSTGIGYLFRPGYILTASRNGQGEPKFVKLAGDRRPARVVATRSRFETRVTLLQLSRRVPQSAPIPFSSQEKPVNLTPATACLIDKLASGYLLGWRWSRTVNFVARNGSGTIPVGSPVFVDDRLVGLAAQRCYLPERFALAILKLAELLLEEIIERKPGQLQQDQLTAAIRTLWSNLTRLWSLHELMADESFARHLGEESSAEQSDLFVSTDSKDDAPIQEEPASAAASEIGAPRPPNETARQIDDEMVILEKSPPAMWAPLEREPRLLPLGPRSRAGNATAILLVALTIMFSLFGIIAPYLR